MVASGLEPTGAKTEFIWMTTNFAVDVLVTAIPLFGIICLLIGIALCFRYPDKKLLLFLTSLLSSGALAVWADYFKNEISHPEPILHPFLALRFFFLAFLVFWLQNARPPAIFLAIFSIINAWWTALFAEMSVTGMWL